MTTIAIAGATGTLGTKITERLNAQGDKVIPLARAHGIDLHTGAGLDQALIGAQVLVDVSNPFPTSAVQDLEEALVGATRRLVAAAQNAGVQRLVFVSINNVKSPAFDDFPYFLAKRHQEEVVRQADIKSAIVTTAQWFEFATNPAAVAESDDHLRVEDWLIQPVAADTVANAVIEAATGTTASNVALAGPEPMRLPQLTAAWLAARGDSRSVITAPASHPALADGTLLAPGEARIVGPTMQEWLQA